VHVYAHVCGRWEAVLVPIWNISAVRQVLGAHFGQSSKLLFAAYVLSTSFYVADEPLPVPLLRQVYLEALRYW
jgi:hypothetical protein